MNISPVSLKVRVGFTLALIVLGLSGAGLYLCVTDLTETASQARRGGRVVAALEAAGGAVRAGEAARRAWAVGRDETDREAYREAQARARAHLAALQEVAAVPPARKADFGDLRRRVEDLFAAPPEAPRPDADGLLRDLGNLVTRETQALEKQEERTGTVFALASAVIAGACCLSLVIALVSLRLVNAGIEARRGVEAALHEARATLETRVAERTAQMARINDKLRQEIVERRRAEQELHGARAQLEKRVAERTHALHQANADRHQKVREHAQLVADLDRTSTLQRAILASANYAIIATDPDGLIVTFNAAARRWLGYAKDEVVGRHTPALFHDPDELARCQDNTAVPIGAGFEVLVERARRGVPYEQEWTYVRKDGTRFPVLLSVTALLREEVEDVTGFLVIGSDISQRRRNERELKQAKDAAEAASRTKSEFLANMSHELRTPLNSVIGFTNVLLKNKAGTLREQDLGFLQRVLGNGKHLLGLINQVLDLAKVEAGRMELDLASVSLPALVHETLAQLEGQVRDKDVALAAEVPLWVAPLHADAGKLKQVLINLVGNAVKFTERGSVTVRAEADAATGRALALEVRDTGVGIAPDKLSSIFEAFQQADVSTTRKYGGTGLGLTIARSLCELMGYPISVASRVGVGTTFRVAFPRPASDAEPRGHGDAERQAQLARPTGEIVLLPQSIKLADALAPCLGKGKSVLVIDDDADSRLLLTQYLEDCGCRVVAVGSGQEGLHYAKEFRPDLFVLDLMMPGMSGWDVLKTLKAHPDLGEVPVVVVSIVARENRGTVYGAVDLLDKPVSREALAEMLRRNLTGRRGVRSKALVVDDNDDARRLAAAYLAEEGFLTREAVNGRDALDKLDGFSPDLVILELMMPVMDGMLFLEALRRDPRYLQLPVIVVTAKELTAEELDRLRADAAAVLRKGDDLADGLRRVVRGLLA